MSEENYDDDAEPGFFRRYGVALGVVTLLAAGGVYAATQTFSDHEAKPRPQQTVTMVKLFTPPPPPPPPPPQTVEQPKMIQETALDDTPPPDDPAPADNTPAASTNITGNGPPDGFGLRAGGGNGNYVGPRHSSQQGTRWAGYGRKVRTAIDDALRKNAVTQKADFRTDVRIWADVTGRVTRAVLGATTGDPKTDQVLIKEVLTGLQLDAPPSDMPWPIVLRVSAQRPN